MPPHITADPSEDKVELSKILAGNASFNNLSVAELESMVAPEYHAQKLHARDRVSEEAQPINGGERERENTRGETQQRQQASTSGNKKDNA